VNTGVVEEIEKPLKDVVAAHDKTNPGKDFKNLVHLSNCQGTGKELAK
jgi:hypothetical protein